VRYIQTGSLGKALQVGEVITMVRSDLKTWLIVFLLIILFGMVGSVGALACGIGIIFTVAYSYMGIGHILGQVLAQQQGLPATQPTTGTM
jgi:uncharacterized membrane protein